MIPRFLFLKWPAAEGPSPSDHGRLRYARASRTAGIEVVHKFLTVAIGLLLAPLCIRALGPEGYGLWMAVAATMGVLGAADLGVGNGLVNEIAFAEGIQDHSLARRAASTSLVLMTALGAGVTVVAMGLSIWFPWRLVLSVATPTLESECRILVAIIGGTLGVGLPAGLAGRVHHGRQRGAITAFCGICGSTVSALLVLAAIASHQRMPVIVLAGSLGPPVAGVLASLHLFVLCRPWGPHHDAWWDPTVARRLLARGSLILVAQVATAGLMAVGPMVLARSAGLAAVTGFSVLQRMFGAASILAMTAGGSMWPAYAEALARNDGPWMRQALRVTVATSLAASVLPLAATVAIMPQLLPLFGLAIEGVGWALVVGTALLQVALSVRATLAAAVGGCGCFATASRVMVVAVSLAATPLLVPSAPLLLGPRVPLWLALVEGVIIVAFWRTVDGRVRALAPARVTHDR